MHDHTDHCLDQAAQTFIQPENSHIDPADCGTCHPKQAETYRLTGMRRSFYRPNPSSQIENYARGLVILLSATRAYPVFRIAGTLFAAAVAGWMGG